MSKTQLFNEDSEEDEVTFKTRNEYAKKYDTWREKEEIHKLQQKYGNLSETLSTDSEDDDEPPNMSEDMEKQFLKILSMLKTKDERIYDPKFKFFDVNNVDDKKEEEKPTVKQLSFDDSDEEDQDDGNIFKIEKKASDLMNDEKNSPNEPNKENKLKDFLLGKTEHVDEEVDQDLAALRALWSDPKLNEGEAFLRDYILNKRYLEEGDAGEVADRVRDDEDLDVDDETVEEQGKFERAYNFRFEEPDQEYLKRFPRTMNYIRPKDDRRARKRAEIRSRKEQEKQRKMEEIARLKAFKLKEIQEKIAKIQEVTGNQDILLQEQDLEGDFDPEEYDRRMKALFDEQYYGEADNEKPVFPDLDEELEIENWEKYDREKVKDEQNDDGPHCEDDDFNMDADYDPKQARNNLLQEIKSNLGKKKRNRKKKSKLTELLSEEKPKFIPTLSEKKYSEYMEEYYKMDCEDVIGGDLPTRFKYRQVVPNDYGLTIEEILLADDKELTQWVPLKSILKYKPENLQKGEVKMYANKTADIKLKKKILPSLFKDLPEEPEIAVPLEEGTKKKKKNKSNSDPNLSEKINTESKRPHRGIENRKQNINDSDENSINENEINVEVAKKKKRKKNKGNGDSNLSEEINIEQKVSRRELENGKQNINESDDIRKNEKENNVTDVCENKRMNEDHNLIHKKKKKKHSFIVENIRNENPSQNSMSETSNLTNHKENQKTVKESDITGKISAKKRKLKLNPTDSESQVPFKKKAKNTNIKDKKNNYKKKSKHNKFKANTSNEKNENPLNKLSDERLKAYGLNPKKYRGFLKYKKF